MVHVKITAECSPEDTFKCADPLLGNDTSHEANVHLREALLAMGIAIQTPRSMLLDIAKERRLVIIEGLTDILRLSMGLIFVLIPNIQLLN